MKPIKVGVIAAAHGIRGEVKIRSFIQPPEAVFTCGILTDVAGKQRFDIIMQGGNEKAFIASIKGLSDRNAAELLKGTVLYASADALPKKQKGEYYSHDLIGLEARLEGGASYGRVTQLYNFGAGDIIEITLPDGKNEMLPMKEPFVRKICADDKYIIVSPPDYVEE